MRFTMRNRQFNITSRYVALGVVMAVFGVIIPRLISVFVMGDGNTDRLGEDNHYALLVTSAVAGAIMLALGNAFIAHVLASRFNRRNGLWYLLGVAWGLNLVFAVVLIAPALMVGLQRSPLAAMLTVTVEPLPRGLMQWVYCIVAVMVFDMLEAGAMAALAIVSQDAQPLTARVTPAKTKRNTKPQGVTPPITQSDRDKVRFWLDETNGTLDNATIAAKTGVKAASVRAYRSEWNKQHNPLAVPSVATPNGNGQHGSDPR